MILSKPLTALACMLLLFISCTKEESFEIPKNYPNNGGPGGNDSWGWSFNSDTTIYSGCVDTASFEIQSPAKILHVSGIDSAGNEFLFMVTSITGNITPGTYPIDEVGYVAALIDGESYLPTQPGSGSITITSINDTLVEGTFSATLPALSGGPSIQVTDGKVRAKIGKSNPCE